MIEPGLIDAQMAIERDQIRIGLQRLREDTQKAEVRNYASSTIYGRISIAQLHPLIAKRLEDTRTRISAKANGYLFTEINQYLDSIETDHIVAIGLRIFFDNVFSPDINNRRVTNLCKAVGTAVEQEAQIRHYATIDPDYLDTVKRYYWHQAAGTHQKHYVAQLMFNRKTVKWDRWPVLVRVKLGGWIADAICEESGWFMKTHVKHYRKDVLMFGPTPDYIEQRSELMAEAEYLSPCLWPMLIPPVDWSPTSKGGYLLNEVAPSHYLIRGARTDSQSLIQPDGIPYKFINNLQKVGYRMNKFVVDVAEVLLDRGYRVGSFQPVTILDLPPKPVDIATNAEARKSYCREAAGVYNLNAAVVKNSIRTRCTMEMVQRFRDVERYYIPWSYDYRGRCYPIPNLLGPQDTDFGKSLVRFATEAVVTTSAEFWLAFQVATAYGLDKATIMERHTWTSLNNPLISRVATDPLGNLADWEVAADPWQFLAACDEFYRCVITRERTTTGLPVGLDATCSGLQILAGLARDQSTAALVNVIPGERPQDAYLAVAEKAKDDLPDELAALMDRKVTKRTVMTIPYNAKEFSNRSYIRQALKEKGVKLESAQVQQITKAVVAAMNTIVPGPMSVMKWINKEVAAALARGARKLRWVTPSGFPVMQYLQKQETVRIQMALLGECRLHVPLGPSEKIDSARHKAATAPNLIHSLDASLIQLAFHDYNLPFTVIHDCVMGLATDLDSINTRVRQAYTKLFSETDYLTEFATQIEAETPPPIIGDFDPVAVSDSTYFFS